MPLDYKQLGLAVPRPIKMRLMMEYRSLKLCVGILYDFLLKEVLWSRECTHVAKSLLIFKNRYLGYIGITMPNIELYWAY